MDALSRREFLGNMAEGAGAIGIGLGFSNLKSSPVITTTTPTDAPKAKPDLISQLLDAKWERRDTHHDREKLTATYETDIANQQYRLVITRDPSKANDINASLSSFDAPELAREHQRVNASSGEISSVILHRLERGEPILNLNYAFAKPESNSYDITRKNIREGIDQSPSTETMQEFIKLISTLLKDSPIL